MWNGGLFFPAGDPGPSPALKEMKQGEHRMAVCHARTREFHDFPYFFTLGRGIAMDRTVGARRLILLKRTLYKARFRIILKGFAFRAKPFRAAMTGMTIYLHHRPDGPVFPCHSRMALFHADIPSAHSRTSSVFLPRLVIHYRMTEAADFHNDPHQITWTMPVKYFLCQRLAPEAEKNDRASVFLFSCPGIRVRIKLWR